MVTIKKPGARITGGSKAPPDLADAATNVEPQLTTNPPPAILYPDETEVAAHDSDAADFKLVKRLRLLSGASETAAMTILGQRGKDRFSFEKKKHLNRGVLGKVESSGAKNYNGPVIRKLRDARNTVSCVFVKRKYSNENPFVPKYVSGALKSKLIPDTLREEGMGFDQYAKVEVPETEDDRAGAGYERYFEQTYNGGKTHITSDNTLAQLQALEPSDLVRGIAQAKAKLSNAISWLSKLNATLFPQWRFEIDQGFNLLFYGYGSKRVTLENFARDYLQPSRTGAARSKVVVINGYFPDLTLRSILTTITQDGIGLGPCSTARPMETVAAIRSHFELDKPHRTVDKLYLVVHNLDGENLRTSAAQQLFAGLCGVPQISVVASVDNIRSSLLWDQASLSQMNFIWHELATYAPYEAETSFESSPLVPLGAHPGGHISIRGVTHVLASLNDKAKGIFKILLQSQIDSEHALKAESAASLGQPMFGASLPTATKVNDEPGAGLPAEQLFNLSRKRFLTSSLPAFKASLREFIDHGLIKETKTSGGLHLHVPVPLHSLKAILELSELAELK